MIEISRPQRSVPAPSVRLADAADAPALARLLAAFMHEEGKPADPAPSPAEVAGWMAEPAPHFEALVALAGDSALGYLAFYEAFTLFKPGRVLLVENLYVSPEGRGLGLGRRLMAAAAQEARRRDFVRLELHVRYQSAAAQGFYRSLGLEPAQEAVYRIEDGALDGLAEAE